MMKMLMALALAAVSAAPLHAEVAPGQPAPDFTLNDQDGTAHKLSDSKGKYVVLEWYNSGCPFVRRHYDANKIADLRNKSMQGVQKAYKDKGVVWYTISSSAAGKQGALTPKNAAKTWKKEGMASTLLLDSNRDVARAYGAKTTPHMFVIDPKGNVIYMGAVDDNPSTDAAELKGAHNYVAAALDASMSGLPVPKPVTTSYGCSVKY
ncbi:MAG: thioredoxin family protein [Elusimicrobiota bacterium]